MILLSEKVYVWGSLHFCQGSTFSFCRPILFPLHASKELVRGDLLLLPSLLKAQQSPNAPEGLWMVLQLYSIWNHSTFSGHF